MSLWRKINDLFYVHNTKPFAYINSVLLDSDTQKPVLDYSDLTENPPFTGLSLFPSGIIFAYGGTVAPTGFLLLGASITVSRVTFASLFAIIGITFGAGDGLTTFGLPDSAAVVLRGAGTAVGYTTNPTIALGAKTDDQFQGHYTNIPTESQLSTQNHASPSRISFGEGSALNTKSFTTEAVTDGTNGTPRIGNETRVKSLGVNFIISI